MQQNRFDIHTAPQTPLRAEPRHPRQSLSVGHIQGVDATSGGLLRSTAKAAGVAVVLLTVFYLPSEYGVDPTGLGGVLGLTEMGKIKQQLYAEAAGEAPQPVQMVADAETLSRLDRIEAQLAAIGAVIGAEAATPATTAEAPPEPEQPSAAAEPDPLPTPEPVVETTAPAVEAAVDEALTEPAIAGAPDGEWRDEYSVTLAPGEGIEVKLKMTEGEVAQFYWTANGAVVNHDTHGDGPGQKITYEQGRSVADQRGELVAAFTGNHGWFWRNRGDAPVTLNLWTGGDYESMKKP